MKLYQLVAAVIIIILSLFKDRCWTSDVRCSFSLAYLVLLAGFPLYYSSELILQKSSISPPFWGMWRPKKAINYISHRHTPTINYFLRP